MVQLNVTQNSTTRPFLQATEMVESRPTTAPLLNRLADVVRKLRGDRPKVCPRCGGESHHSKGRYRELFRRWTCNSCGKTFNDTTDLPVKYIRKIEPFLTFWYDEKYDQLSVRKAGEFLGVDYRTVHSWRQKKRQFESVN